MKRTTHRTRRQLALTLQAESRTPLPTETRSALIGALADLLLEALAPEEGRPIVEGERDEPEDHA
jgi:hypothetical protein